MLACLWKRQKKEELITIGYFRVPRASVSKRAWVVSLWYDNDFSFSCKESHFHKKGCALALILKVRVFATHKWPIFHRHSIVLCNKSYPRHSWILDSTLWIADCSTVKIGFRIPVASKILDSLSWIRFQSPGIRIPRAKVSRITNSTSKDFSDCGIWITLNGTNSKKSNLTQTDQLTV